MNTPNRTTAAAFSRFLNGEILADSRSLQWSDLYVRHCRFPGVVDRFLVPATAEPHISCTIVGSAEFLERDPGGKWVTRHIRRGDIFVTRSPTPYEVSFRSPPGEELETIAVHVGIDSFRVALEAIYPGNTSELEVIDFFGRDVALSRLCAACADLLSAHVPGSSRIVAAMTQLLATYLAEKYTSATSGKPEVRGGLPIRQLQKVGDFVTEHLAEEISVEILAELVQLSPFHFSRIFKQSTGMSPLRARDENRASAATLLAGSCSACRGLAVKDFGCLQGGAELCRRHFHYTLNTRAKMAVAGVSDLQGNRWGCAGVSSKSRSKSHDSTAEVCGSHAMSGTPSSP